MQRNPPKLTLAEYELRYGSRAQLPRHMKHGLSEAVQKAIRASNEERRAYPVAGTSLELQADLRQKHDGNSLCIIYAGGALSSAKLKAGTLLHLAVGATRESRAPTAWRHVLGEYLAAMASSPQGIIYSSFGPMPKELPWTVGFVGKDAAHLKPEDYNTVITVARLASLYLADQCESASLAAERAGTDFTPDPEQFPELL